MIVKYYYKIYNQQITKIINNMYYFLNFILLNIKYTLLLVGISESLRTQQNNIIKNINQKMFSKINHNNDLISDNHNNEISLKFKQ
jgi:hypothetical protein